MNSPQPSKSEIDRLGERLRVGVSEDDLAKLDAYRQSFASAYETIVKAVRSVASVEVSGRSAKSTTAIVDKLKRESIRLSQMQDIAGCRIVVPDITHQDRMADKLIRSFPMSARSDRRESSSHGYRALHLIVPTENRHVEIQIRTQLQHLWAEHSEKLADKLGISVKYGAGSVNIRQRLAALSKNIGFIEHLEANAVNTDPVAGMMILGNLKADAKLALVELLKTAEAENDFLN